MTANWPIFNISPRKSQRALKPITVWEEKKAPPAASDPKITEKTARNRSETALKPISVRPLLESTKFDYNYLFTLPEYHLLFNLRLKPFKLIAIDLFILQTF
jgi:hypothetical protein